MAGNLPTVRLLRARRMLLSAESAAQCLMPLAYLIDLAEESLEAGGPARPSGAGESGQSPPGITADRARRLLDESLGYARAAVAGLPCDSGEYLVALYLRAYAALLRDSADGPVTDLDDGIECLRRLRGALPADTPERADADTRMGRALARRALLPPGRPSDADEACELLTSLLDRLPPDGTARQEVLGQLVMVHWVRLSGLGPAERDREDARRYAEECLAHSAAEDGTDPAGDACRVLLAWLALTERMTPHQRSMMLAVPDAEAVWADGPAAAALLAELGQPQIPVGGAQAALAYLRSVTDAGLGGLGPLAGVLRGAAVGVCLQAGVAVSPADIGRMAEQMREAASAAGESGLDRDMLYGMHAMLLAMRDRASGGPDAMGNVAAPMGDDTTSALNDMAARFPAGHPMRSAGIRGTGFGLGQRVTEASTADDVAGRLDGVVAALERMPDDPEAAQALVHVGSQILGVSLGRRSAGGQERLIARLGAVLPRLGDGPGRTMAESLYWQMSGLQGFLRDDLGAVDAAIDGLIRCADAAPAGNPARTLAYLSAAGMLGERHLEGGDLRHLTRAEECLNRAIGDADPAGLFAPGAPGEAAMMLARGQLAHIRDIYEDTSEGTAALVAGLEQASALLDSGYPGTEGMSSILRLARNMAPLQAMLAGETVRVGREEREAIDAFLDTADQAGPDHPSYPLMLMLGANGLIARGLAERDPAFLDRAVATLAAACAVPDLTPNERPLLLMGHGNGLLSRYHQSRSPADLGNAIGRLEEARRAAEQELASPHLGDVLQLLSLAYRTRGDTSRGDADKAASHGLAGLREHLEGVFLQDSDSNAVLAARGGTNDAAEMARWFLGYGKPEAAVSALELGRGMVLHAATTGAGTAEALRSAGQPSLAGEWARQDQDEAADDLRYRVLRALRGQPAEARLLSPPSVADITAALAAVDADALVYLLPRDSAGLGAGIVVERAGSVRLLPLPALHADPGSPVAAFIGARRAFDAAIRSGRDAGTEGTDWQSALAEVCDWAWPAVIGPLLRAVPARGSREDRRIVLVPTGELGLVPWHAARHPGGRSGYACQEAVLSYAPSARHFEDTARRAFRQWGRRPVLVSDPTGSPYYSAAGIRGLYTAHYPGGAVYGDARRKLPGDVPGAPAATPDDVLAVLPRGTGQSASILHLGCHAAVQVPVLGSSLDLGAGGKLAVRDILRQARAGDRGNRSAGENGALVVLASCLSDVTEADYDEALTLGTAFLSAGAGGVVAAKWAVRESTTAIFMAMFHHYLNGSCPSPARALRQAQVWMLGPVRDIPDSMPRELRQEAALPAAKGGPDLAGPEAWAGFSYQGW